MKCDVALLWDTHSKYIESFVRRRVQDEELAKDLLQDVLLKVCLYCDAKNDVKNVRHWLFQITRNVIVDHFRRKHKWEDLVPDGPMPKLSEENESALNAEYLDLFIQQLPEKYRMPLLWSDLEQIPQTEIAKRLNISLSGAKSRVQRARQYLKALLLQCCQLKRDSRGGIVSCIPHPSCHCLMRLPDSFQQEL